MVVTLSVEPEYELQLSHGPGILDSVRTEADHVALEELRQIPVVLVVELVHLVMFVLFVQLAAIDHVWARKHVCRLALGFRGLQGGLYGAAGA